MTISSYEPVIVPSFSCTWSKWSQDRFRVRSIWVLIATRIRIKSSTWRGSNNWNLRRIYHLPMGSSKIKDDFNLKWCSVGSRISYIIGVPTAKEGRGTNLLFCPIFTKNCMKMKKIWTRRACPLRLLGSAKVMIAYLLKFLLQFNCSFENWSSRLCYEIMLYNINPPRECFLREKVTHILRKSSQGAAFQIDFLRK